MDVPDTSLETTLRQETFDYIAPEGRAFILAFEAEMQRLGYTSGGAIGEGYCWGRHMIIYTKAGVKSKKSYARVYIQDEGLILRLYFSDVDKHRAAVEAAPPYIQEAFVGSHGACGYCHNQREDGSCSHRKRYTLHGQLHEKCDGFTFWFPRPQLAQLPEYSKLFLEFYPPKKKKA